MKDILDQTRAANAAGLFYLALFSALALPDICAALESPDGQATGDRYKSWFNRYVQKKWITGEAVYYFRCAMLHQGRTGHPRGFSKIIFVEPNASNFYYHDNIIRDALNIDVRLFVEDVVLGVEEWLKAVASNADYLRNVAESVQRYPGGLPPYFYGLPVIA